MATDKKGGGLEDLKSRLGLDSVLSKARAAETKPPAPPTPPPPGTGPAAGPSDGGAQRSASTGTPAAAPPQPVPEPVPVAPVIDFGAPPPVFEHHDEGVEEEARAFTGGVTAASKTTRIAILVVSIVILFLALAAGFGFGKGMRERQVGNEIINSAASVREQLVPVVERLTQFQAALTAAGTDYTPELHGLFTETFAGAQAPVVTTGTLIDGRILLTASQEVAEELITFSTATQILLGLVGEHVRKTNADQAIIDQLVAGNLQTPNYGIVFDSDAQAQNYRTFFCQQCPACSFCRPPDVEDADLPVPQPDAMYIPPQGHVVTYVNLERTTQGEGPGQRWFYNVMWGGQERQIEIYNFLTIDAEQVQTAAAGGIDPNQETALDRYRSRVTTIRNYLDNVLRMQTELMRLLDEAAARETVFTI